MVTVTTPDGAIGDPMASPCIESAAVIAAAMA
jgi:hypothetical protein